MTADESIVELHDPALQAITTASRQHLPFECGGILLGYRGPSRIVVTQALVVPTTTPSTTRYTRDDTAANAMLRDFVRGREPGDPVGYVGEWHSHPAPSCPSSIDIGALRATMRHITEPLALLVCTPGAEPGLTAAVATRDRLHRLHTRAARLSLPPAQPSRLGPLPPGAVRADGPVFISYRHSDGYDSATHLEGLLQASGLVVWRDERDLRGGTTVERLERALTGGLSGALLVVTPDIAHSSVVRENELPRLLQLDEDPAFSLNIANEIANPDDPAHPDYSAPDRLLGLTPARTLQDKKHSDTRATDGQQEIVRDLLMHRIEERKTTIERSARTLTLAIQTRPAPFASEADHSDLHVRIPPATTGRLPSHQGLEHLQTTLPLTSDAVHASGADAVRIRGGAHISVAFALGAALPTTKIGRMEVVDLTGAVWSSDAGDDPGEHEITTTTSISEAGSAATAPIAVFVTLTDAGDMTAFERLTGAATPPFRSVSRIEATPSTPLDHSESARLSFAIAREIRRLSAQYGRSDVHLAYHGPYTLAVLIGRHLNTVRTVIYEWDNPEDIGPNYAPALTLEAGTVRGPIARVLL